MPQKSNNPLDQNQRPGSSIPQDQDDELEMANDDEDFDEDDDFDTEDEADEDEGVEEA